MSNDETQPDGKQENVEESSIETTVKPLLSQNEIRSIVKDFAIAYIEGRIKIAFVSAEEKMEWTKREGKQLSYSEAVQAELSIKTMFSDEIAICLGAKKATSDELQVAICNLFDKILYLRNGGRIEGAFVEHDLANKVRTLEEGLDKVNNLVKEIVEWITGLPSEGRNDDNKLMP